MSDSLTVRRALVKRPDGRKVVPHKQDVGEFAAILRNGGMRHFHRNRLWPGRRCATNSDAVLKIYETKGRPRFNPLIVHVADLAMAEAYVEFAAGAAAGRAVLARAADAVCCR